MSQTPLQITFRGTPASDAVRNRIARRAAKLLLFHPRIEVCHVVVKVPKRLAKHGQLFNIRIDVKAPKRSIVINRNPALRRSHADIYVAIRDAFDALDRRLEDEVRRRRGDVKAHSRDGATA
jgi:ribosome-associated translation inhibitor RaiA